MRSRKVLCVLVLGAVLSFGCGGDDKEEPLVVLNNSNNVNNANNANNVNNANNANNENNANNGISELEVVLDTSVTTTATGQTENITFEVPEGAQSVVVNVIGTSPNQYTLNSWIDPDGTQLVTTNWVRQDQFAPQFCTGCLQRVTSAVGAFAAMAPTNQDVELVAGTHTIQIEAFSVAGNRITGVAGEAQILVTAKVAPERPPAGTIDLNFFFTGARGWTAETAQTDQVFQGVIEEVRTLYAQVGIELGDLAYYDISEDYQVIEIDQTTASLSTLFAESRVADNEAVNLFFVDELMQSGPLGGFGVVLGISGGIPGPTGQVGTARSGVAIATKSMPGVPTPMSKVIAHEVGHYLGLYHTAEQLLPIQDQLDDTSGSADELMNAAGNGDRLSEFQGVVMRLNPWVKN